MTVKVQRRTATPTRNALNEPDYGAEASYPVIYASMPTRIEYTGETMEFMPSGERVALAQSMISGTDMYVDPAYTIQPEDRITVLTSDNTTIIGQLYLVMSVISEWDGMGNVHHFIAQMQIH